MKFVKTSLLFSLVIPFSLQAQFVADNNSSRHKEAAIDSRNLKSGTEVPQWSKEEDRINGRIPSKQLAKMRSVTDSIIALVQGSFIREGQYNLLWHGEYTSEKVSGTAQMKFGAACNFGEGKASLTVMANDLGSFMEPVSLNNHDYMAMPPVKSMQNDCPYYEIAGQEENAHSRVWMITNNNQLPYTVVTRKEFLEEGRGELELIKKGMLAELSQKIPVRSREAQEAEKKAALDQINNSYSGANLQMQLRMFERDYRSDEDYFKANAEKLTAGVDAQMHFLDSLRTSLPAEELKRPAPIAGPITEFNGFGNDVNDRILVKLNPAYYSPVITSEKPQIFLVTWNYNDSENQAKDLDNQLNANFNAGLLKALLNK